jgi:hypothetical protein
MNDHETAGSDGGISTRTMEIIVAVVLLAVSALVVYDSYRLGSKWGDDGPQSGYFPFYIGLLLGLASVGTLVRVFLTQWRQHDKAAAPTGLFVEWGQLKLVLSVLVPAVVYVLAVQLFGMYVASADLHHAVHALARPLFVGEERRDRLRRQRGDLRAVRNLVQGPALQGRLRRSRVARILGPLAPTRAAIRTSRQVLEEIPWSR